MIRTLASIALSIGLLLPLVAESPAPQTLLPDDPSALLGYGLSEAIAERGVPASVSVFRGAEPWQDDVVFEYPEGFSFFWFGNHLWQIRFVAGYKAPVFGLYVGDAAEKAVSLLGQPYYTTTDALVFRLPWRGYPVQLRVVLRDSRVSELYVFRADF